MAKLITWLNERLVRRPGAVAWPILASLPFLAVLALSTGCSRPNDSYSGGPASGVFEQSSSSGSKSEPSPSEVDQLIARAKRASIAFNTPDTIELGDSAPVDLVLLPQRSEAEAEALIKEPGTVRSAAVKYSPRMSAILEGPGLTVTPEGPQEKAISSAGITRWQWRVTPDSDGMKHLTVTVNMILKIEGNDTPYEVTTYERTFPVTVSWQRRAGSFVTKNWQWILTAILLPAVGWIIAQRRRFVGALRKLFSRGQPDAAASAAPPATPPEVPATPPPTNPPTTPPS